jgi:hypothetical protein
MTSKSFKKDLNYIIRFIQSLIEIEIVIIYDTDLICGRLELRRREWKFREV